MTPDEQRRASDGIGSRILSGLAWKAGSQIVLQITRMTVALILARLLSPHDWGLAAMVLVFSGFVVVFTDNALGTALIQRRDLRPGDRSTVFWVSAGVGLVLALVGMASAGALAGFYGEPDVRWLFVALSAGFLISALGTTQMALLVREMEFRKLELRQIAATIVGASVGIAIAIVDRSAWAIVGQLLAEASTSTALLWVLTPWRPSFTFSTASLRRLGGFAGNVFAENMLWQAGRTLISVLIGRVLGAAALGTYALATTVILMPFSRIAAPLQQVFFPAFSQMNDDRERMADIWIRATRLVGVISIPALVGLVVVAPDFVQVVLGSRWSDATTVIQVLAVVGIVQSLHTLNGEVLMALGKAGTLLRYTMLWTAGSIAAVVIGLQGDIVSVAVCYAIATLLMEPLRAWVTTRALGIPLWRFVSSLSGIAQATALMAGALVVARLGLVEAGAPAWLRLVLLIVLGGVVYIPSCLWRAPEVTQEIKSAVGRRNRRPAPRVDPLDAGLLEL
jgi:O-antigen/teichoic acid export membrane protein